MNKYILYTLPVIVFFLTSCENEIVFKGKDKEPLLVINALLDATKAENYIYLNLTGNKQSVEVKDATVDIYVNGVHTEVANYRETAEYGRENHFYSVTSSFKPEDKIEVKAVTQDGKYHANAQITVPVPVSITHIDTATVTKNNESGYQPIKYLRFKITFKDRPGESNFYRLVIEKKDTWKSIGAQQESINTAYNYDIINKEDIVLTDGNPSYVDDDDWNDLFGQAKNRYSVFDDSRFRNSEYTMTASMLIGDPVRYNSEQKELFTKTMTVKLLSISETEYYYLKALNIFDSDDYNEVIYEPIRFPSNVNGGAGIVGISTESNQSFPLMEIKFD